MSCGCNNNKEQPRGGDLDYWTPPTVDKPMSAIPSWFYILVLVLVGIIAYRKLM